MKYLLILLFLFSTQSFANLDGKGLLCIDKEGYPMAYYFYTNITVGDKVEKRAKYRWKSLFLKIDTISIKEVKDRDYSTNKDFIDLGNIKINRKTLEGIYNGKVVGTCEVSNDQKDLDIKINEMKEQYQQKLNKTLEGNKI